jgi:hypothetical protein
LVAKFVALEDTTTKTVNAVAKNAVQANTTIKPIKRLNRLLAKNAVLENIQTT